MVKIHRLAGRGWGGETLYDGSSTPISILQLGKLRLVEAEQGVQGRRANPRQRRTPPSP